MLNRKPGRYLLHTESSAAPELSQALENDGYCVIRGAFPASYIKPLHAAVTEIYDSAGIDHRSGLEEAEQDDFRYACFNRSALVQKAIGERAILDVIEPLLGQDCHVIANTCWRNPPREKSMQGGGHWHVDGGPHVPHDMNVRWNDDIPYPVFAIGVHIMLEDCPMASGPTAVIPGSHKSGQPPPLGAGTSTDLTCYDQGMVALEASAGDVALFVSDIWHRRLATTPDDNGRFFIQCHYGRRDIAQRVLPTAEINHVSPEAMERAATERDRTLIGLHNKGFYDG